MDELTPAPEDAAEDGETASPVSMTDQPSGNAPLQAQETEPVSQLPEADAEADEAEADNGTAGATAAEQAASAARQTAPTGWQAIKRPSKPALNLKPLQLPAAQEKGLRRFVQSAALALQQTFELALPCTFEITPTGVEFRTLSPFLEETPEYSISSATSVSGGAGTAWMVWDPAIAHPLLELELGGQLADAQVWQRELTEVETDLMTGLAQLAASALSEGAGRGFGIDFQLLSVGGKDSIDNASQADATVLVVTMEAVLGDEYEGRLYLVLPRAILPRLVLRQSIPTAARKEKPSISRSLHEALGEAEVNIEAQLAGGSVFVRELVSLRVGSVLAFDRTLEEPVRCLLNQKEYFEGRILRQGNRLAFQVHQRIERQRGIEEAQNH